MTEVAGELVPTRRYRTEVPATHRASLDTRILWLWNQRFGTVQMVFRESPDVLDHTAAVLLLQAFMAQDLDSIAQVFNRIEGGALPDDEQLERGEPTKIRL